jgi:carbamoylphosphate synthase small subunit
MQHQKILILDFGSQVTQLIARRVREAHVYSEVHPCDVSDEWIREYAKDGTLKGVILSGSHASVYEESTDKAPAAVFELGVPVLGICYGMQTWRTSWAARSKADKSASSVLPRCVRMGTRRCSRTSLTSPRLKATACSTYG